MEDYQIKQTITIDFARAGVPPRVYAKQYDNNMRVVAVELCADGLPYEVPEDYSVNVRLLKPDGKHVYNPALQVDGSTIYIVLTQQMLAVAGSLTADIEVVKDTNQLKSAAFYIMCEASAVPEESVESTDEYITIQQLAAAVDRNATTAAKSEAAAKQAAADAATSATAAGKSQEQAATAQDAAKKSAADAATSATAAGKSQEQAAMAQDAAEKSAAGAEKSKEEAATFAKTADDAATKVINEGVAEKLAEMQRLDGDVTEKAKATTTAADTAVKARDAATDAANSAAASLQGANAAQQGAQGFAADALAAAKQAQGYAGAATTALGYDSEGKLTFYYDDGEG